jgi:hypothetical protein
LAFGAALALDLADLLLELAMIHSFCFGDL